jgi:site-specific DNA-methyltransferase (adenine-specific)
LTEGTVAEVLAGTAGWTVLGGDSLLALRELPDGCVDLVLADPPYSSGGQFRGDRARPTGEKYVLSYGNHENADFAGDTRDQKSFELWTALWCAEAWRVAREGCVGMLFTDWRQLGATADAFQAGGWVFRGVAAWDKGSCRPRNGGLRQQCEFVVWGSRGPLVERDVYLDGCLRVSVEKDKLHQAAKPDAVLSELVRLCPPGGLVLDPFPGSGSVGIACARAGLRYIGIEIVPGWAELSRERLRAEHSGSTLEARASGQLPLLGGVSNVQQEERR